jgi:hypothetical protein
MANLTSSQATKQNHTNLAGVTFSEATHIITQSEELNQTHGVDIRVLTCVPPGPARNQI